MGLRVASLFLLWLALSSANEIKKGRTRSHGHYVCSTWGNNHFKTFDGDIYQFPGVCEYNFVSDCREAYKEFSVHIQRALNSNGHPEIEYILLKIKDIMVYLKPNLVVVDGRIVKTPYYTSGVLIESNEIYTKIYAKLGMVLMWNQQDALMVELDNKFNNHTCGLCGDYNGIQIYNEFIKGDASYNSITYGNMQKISKPNSKCEDPDETQALPSCNEHRDECQRLLTSPAFADCRLRLNLEMYIQACMQDKCACTGKSDSFCLCSTISEYSRQCSHAGGRPGEWRTQSFCPKTCPATMVYKESSSPCVDTCSHLQISSLCEEHYMDGCFCPEGTVYDDISEKGCIPVSQCHCKLSGKSYAPGESISKECEECTCNSGRWTCKDLPCPGTCSVEGGSHFTTFDGKKYTFHGDCYYVLAKGTANESYALLAELAPCGSTEKQTCLKTVVLLVDNKKNVVVFRSDGSVLLNEMTVNVPHVSTSFSVFKPSSNYFVVQTPFGLQMQIQLFPVMQLFVTVEQSLKGTLQGLCGNFNGMEGDDFRTTSGLIEATGSAFANTWKAQSTCADQAEKLEDPCSLSIESANYAEHWCSLLRNPKGPFARCHIAIDPSEYYKKCKYDTCLCEDSEECLCAALSSYSRACAFKGIILGGWRKSVCSNEESSCPGNQVFLYNLTMCQQTCRSLADGEKYCLQDFAPVDGCGCPPDTYFDNQANCVPISQCPCYYKGSYLEPGEYFTKDEERCVCRNARIQCTSVKIRMKSEKECSSNKTYFDCNALSKWTSQTPLQLSCHTPQTDHFQAECVSGCVCPEGLFDDGRGGCVEQKDCPCIHNNQWYSSGHKIKVDCNTCTCQKGVWKCTDDVCYGTCMIYGSGHYNTFDGKFYDFDGSCEYVATQDFCGDKNSSGSFSIITENVPCGTTGVTCSKAIKMFLGKTELKLENKEYKEIQRDVGDDVQYWNRTVGLYLVIEASNGVMLIWDKKTTVFIKLSPDYKGKVCGLCGNFDDKANNDFTTRSGLQDNNPLNFGNSWKQSPMCPDVTEEIKPCDLKPHRKSWAEKECSIIQSEIFKICHSKVDPLPYYEACVHDACSCDSGGDCECFCSAVAAYAQECIKAEACVFWRTPDICPIFCDYYNPRNECDWHYEPCGSNITTCRMINNVSTNFTVPLLEGCYPRCPKDKPIYNEETKQCVTEDQCGCYLEDGTHVPPGEEVLTKENCTICVCLPSGSIQCKPVPGCPCVINGTSYEEGATVGVVQDGDTCTRYICAENGSVVPGEVYPCPTSSPTTISTSSPHSTLTTTTTVSTTSHPVTTTPCVVTELICDWTEWFDVSKPEEGGGDFETYDEIRKHGNKICTTPEKIECRAKDKPDVSLEELGQKVECNVKYGLICRNDEQDVTMWPLCYNYEIRVNCCEWQEIPCEPTITPTIPSTTTQTTIASTTTTRSSTEVTTMPIHIHSTTSPPPPTPSTPKSTTTPLLPETPTTTTSTPTTTSTVTGSPTPTSTTSSTSSPTPTYTTTTPTPGSLSTASPPPEWTTTSMSPETLSSTMTTTTSTSPSPSTTTGAPTTTTTVTTTIRTPAPCECIWTDWIDVTYPDGSDRNSGDYETFENIWKKYPSWECAKVENISCRAEKFPSYSIADLGQKVECNVNVGLICNNKDQQIGGIIPMPVCLNYEISVCCIPNKPECLPPPSTTSTTTSTAAPTTSSVSPPISTTAPTSTPVEIPGPTPTPSSTTTTTMPSSSTTTSGSTSQTTTTAPVSTTPVSTTSSTSAPTPTYTTTTPTPGTSLICALMHTKHTKINNHSLATGDSHHQQQPSRHINNNNHINNGYWVTKHHLISWNPTSTHTKHTKVDNHSLAARDSHHPHQHPDNNIHCYWITNAHLNYFKHILTNTNIHHHHTNSRLTEHSIPSTRMDNHFHVTRDSQQHHDHHYQHQHQHQHHHWSTDDNNNRYNNHPNSCTRESILSTCECVWTDWIDVTYPDGSDRNSGDYETFENIWKKYPSWECAKVENISCRAEKFPSHSIADLGQKVECNVNVGLICNNKDQQIGGIIPMPVCLNYEISVCCIPNKPECLPPPSTTSTTTSTAAPTTSSVSPPISTTAPTSTPVEIPSPTPTPSSTTTTTMPPSSTTTSGSTSQTTTTAPVSTTPVSTTSSTSAPTPTYTTTTPTPGTPPSTLSTASPTPPTTSLETPTTTSTSTSTTTSSPGTTTTVTGSPTPTSTTSSTSSPTPTYTTTLSTPGTPPSTLSTPKSTTIPLPPETPTTTTTSPPSTTTTVPGSTTTISAPQTPPPPTPSTPKSTTATSPPETPTTTTTSPLSTTTTVTGSPTPTSTTSSTSSPTPTYTTTTPTPVPSSSTPSTPKSTTLPTETLTSTTSPPSTTTTVTGSPTPTSTTSSASSPTPTYTTTTTPGTPPSTLSTPKSTTTTSPPETPTTTSRTPTTTITTPEDIITITRPVPPTEAIKTPEPERPTTTSTPVTPSVTPLPTTRTTEISTVSTASTTSQQSTPQVSTSPLTATTSAVTETASTTRITTSGPTPSRSTSTTPVTETPVHETTTTRIPSPPTGLPTTTSSPGTTTTAGPSSPTGTQPPISTTPFTGTASTTRITTSGPTPSRSTSTTPVTETPVHETTTTRIPSPPTGLPTTTSSPGTTTTAGPSSPTGTQPPISTTPFTGTASTTRITTSGPTPSVSTLPTTTVGTELSTPSTTSATVTTPTTSSTSTSPVSTTTSGAAPTTSPISTSPLSTTTSGTTPTESFTTTLGTTSSSFITINATTTISTTFKTLPPLSATTSGPTATSTAVTTTGSSTHSATPPVNGSSSTTGLTPTTPKKTCTIFPNESYEQGDSWMLCNCTKVICIEDNIVQVIPIICNPPPKPTCANGLSPVPVMDEDGCCWHWECDCYCTGWGDPHYMTFDGLYYSYQGNCTYVLVEEINKKVDNFGVYIDNYHCDARDVVSCPRTLIVRHETQEVRLTTAQPNTLQVEVTVNNKYVALPYKKFGVSIYESGINRVVEIPELKMNVTYNGLSFSIRMPYSLFGNNTQGQCGTCNNNTADDCMLPNGNIAERCESMADHWQVVDPSKPQCSPGLVPTSSPSTTPTQPCKESSICELLLGSVFKPCHAFVQPEKYYAACVFDSCVLPNLDLECSSLQIYAAVCADQGACIDWRKHTNGVCCKYECPSGKEYRACGPIKEMTCKSRGQNETSTKQVEGCFCPNGTMLYDSGVDVCVKTCGCVGVDKIPREFGEKFTVDCQDCICLEGEHGILCKPHVCDQKKVTCDGEGFYEVAEVNPKDSCCPLFTCKCNTSMCTSKAPKCSLGFEVHSYIPSGQCCPVYQCVPKGVCVHENAEFLPNSSVFVDKCQNCVCTNDVNVGTQLNIISCERVPCNTYCQPGYELKPVKGECCGKCVQTKCIIHTTDNSELILSPGDFKNDPQNNCTIYSCVDIHDQLIASTSEITCPAFNEDSCKPGTISFLPNGCCRTCAPLDSSTPCSVRHRTDFIVYNGCRSVDRVDLTECEGTCGTFSVYSPEANSMDHSCSCCRETSTTEKEVVLKCPGGHAMSHKYIYVESCSCQDTECQRPMSNELQKNEENDQATTLNRIKRAISLTSK
ncbi:mucin-2 [Serinus canaria]|uniref:mucin-2 n=1 Tax=Serinus canaria TaxID=9135 RepID=UPI0021CCA9C5|nr:mucin-2 [Serinus canaria]